MTPLQKVKHLVLINAMDSSGLPAPEGVTTENIDTLYAHARENPETEDSMVDAERSEVRGGEVETGIPCEWSRHYESKSVAAKAPDGSWVGWTYWFGGGKHGEPEAVDWMGDAYDLNCVEEEKMTVTRTFTKSE